MFLPKLFFLFFFLPSLPSFPPLLLPFSCSHFYSHSHSYSFPSPLGQGFLWQSQYTVTNCHPCGVVSSMSLLQYPTTVNTQLPLRSAACPSRPCQLPSRKTSSQETLTSALNTAVPVVPMPLSLIQAAVVSPSPFRYAIPSLVCMSLHCHVWADGGLSWIHFVWCSEKE